MATSRAFAYNTGATVSGTEQVGNLAVVTGNADYGNGLTWINGPDEDLGYVIARSTATRNIAGGGGATASVAFWRTGAKTDAALLQLVHSALGQTFATASEATSWLKANGYWTNAPSLITSNLVVNLDAGDTDSYSGSGTTWTNLVNDSNYTISNGSFDSGDGGSIVFNGTSTFVPIGEPLSSGTHYTMEAWVRADIVTGARNVLSSSNNVFWNNGSTLSGGVGGSFSLVTSSSFPANAWRHVVLTFNDATNTMRLYINGTQVSQNLSVTQSYTSETLRIGSHFGVSPISFWDGKIAQVRVYNTDLSAAGVLNNYDVTKSRYGL
jgi:hypothetical protein